MKRVYFNEYNVSMGRATYVPFVSGILRVCAEARPELRRAYRFEPFIFAMDAPDSMLAHYDERADVACFSASMWNEQLSLHVARSLKRRWPDCLVVFGGAQVPHAPEAYFAEHPFIDVAVRAEGEEAFVGILERFRVSRDFRGIPNVAFRDPDGGGCVVNPETAAFDRDLDAYPSPYLEGRFDDLFKAHPDVDFQAIIETNRGCPFLCTFCYWGKGGTSRRYRYHGLDRVRAEIDWCGRHGIRYVFNADSNFGMHKRDPEIAQALIDTKQRYGFPEKFRTCWGKNTDETIFRIAGMLHAHELEKGITLARQSNSKSVLANIKRGNIKISTYTNLQRRFNDLDVPVYTEMILGLPGETYESWRDGIEELLQAGLKNQFFVYQCEVYPNTDMADPAYRERFGIRLQRIELREIHGSIRDASWVREVQDIVIGTASMSNADWRRMTRLSTLTMLLHSMKAGFFVMTWMADRFGLPYQPVEKGAIDRVSPHGETYCGEGDFAILRDDEDDLSDQNGSSGRNKHENTAISARHRFPRGAGADALAHQQREIVAGDVKQVSLVHVLAPAQPSSAHAAAIQVVGKGALDDLGAPLEGLAGDPGGEPCAVVGDRAPRRLVTAPARKALLLGLGDPGLPGTVVQGLQDRPCVIAFVGDAFGRVLRRRGRIHRLEVCLGHRQGLAKRRGVALIGRVQLGRHHRARVQIHRVLGLVGQMGGAVLHLGDLGLGVALGNPILVRELLALALAVQARQVVRRGRLNAALLGQVFQHLPVALTRVAPHNVPQRRVGLHGRGIHPDAVALHQTRLGDQRQNPVEDRRVHLVGQARAGLR